MDIAPVAMDGPVLVFGGPYSNLEATRAVLKEAQRRGIPARRIVCTGDVVAYGADARDTVAAVRDAGLWTIMGNCEESLAAGTEDCGCGYAAGSACDALSAAWYAHARRTLDAESRRWMANLPRRLDLLLGGRRLAVVHGSPRQINRFIFASTPAAAKREELAAAGVDGIIAGHCGLPFTEVIDGRLWHNAGAIGMPANDGTPRVWFSVLTPTPDGIAVEHHALAFDTATAAAKMRRAGLPEGYAAALETGRWPSCDVLPPAELAAQGRALTPGGTLWPACPAPSPHPVPPPQGGRGEFSPRYPLTPSPSKGEGWGGGEAREDLAPTFSPRWPILPAPPPAAPLDPAKFRHPERTAAGERRASVTLARLRTLWVNTGTLCNIACDHCYIDSSPRNDRLVYLSAAELDAYLDEIAERGLGTEEIGFTGGEPFMNPDVIAMLEDCLTRGFRVLVLTNAMRPMQRMKKKLLDVKARLGQRLTLRVSLDHYTVELHEEERGPGTWRPTLDGLTWLAAQGFDLAVAGRMLWPESDQAMRQGYARLFAEHGIPVDAADPERLVLFPEMDASADVPEITEACWGLLGVSPQSPMCASSRMVVKRKGSTRPSVVACTLLPYDAAFDLGPTLAEASRAVPLNHPHCARFCVLGGGSCSRG